MKALIIDDEPIARQVLRDSLSEFPEVTVIGEAGSGGEALEMIGRCEPDVAFVDLHMPDLDGFGVARALRARPLPVIIFVTAYQEHALEAFAAGAVDYLLKPVRQERLAEALKKARAQMAGIRRVPEAPARQAALRKIVGRLGEDFHLLEPSEVIAFQADGEIVYILTAKGRYYSDYSLRALETRLDASPFRRVHRKTIINTDHIRRVSPLSSKRWLLTMSNGMEVVVSKRLASSVREQTDW